MKYSLISQYDRKRFVRNQRLCHNITLPHVNDVTETWLAMAGLNNINVCLSVACLKYAKNVLKYVKPSFAQLRQAKLKH